MNFQILDADYTYIDNKPLVRLYGRDESGNSICCSVPDFEPYFYVKAGPDMAGSLQEKFRDYIKRIEPVSRFEPVGYFKNPVSMLKIIVHDPKNVPAIRDDVRQMVDEIYETDILFRNRYIIDNGLGGMSWAKAEPAPESIETDVMSNVRITSRKVEPVDILKNAPHRHLAFDIECLPLNGAMPAAETSPIILVSLAFEPQFKGKKSLVLVGKEANPDRDVEVCGSEEAMLNRFFEIIREYDPDILVGYNSNSFDIPYIVERIKALKGAHINSVIGRDGKSIYYRKIANLTRISLMGRIVVDVLPLLRREFSLKQYTLKNTAKELLGMEKLDVHFLEMEEYWKDKGDKFIKLIEYSRRDAELALEFLLKLRLIDKYIALARASGTLLQDILDGGQTQMVENLLLREYRDHERVLPARPTGEASDERFDEGNELKGGEVLEPKKGLLENIVILDYKSLYPTIMMAHNLCYTTVVVKDRPDDVVTAPSGGVFASRKVAKGIMPAILEDLLDRRQATREKMKTASDEEYRVLDATQLALKILLNSFYGYSGYARARLYSLPLASAVTSFGRENILQTKSLIEDELKEIILEEDQALTKDEAKDRERPIGLSVVYGDTDSVFVNLLDKEIKIEEAELIGRKIASIVTSSLQKPMELVFDSFGRRAIFIAKKRYAVWVFERTQDGWKDKIRVKGMETVRRDWCELTTKTVEKVLELVLKEGNVEDAVELVKNTINDIRSIDARKDPGLYEDLILTRQFTKKVESYKSRQPHTTVVEKMRKRGIAANLGDRIPFVILAGSGLFVERAEDPEYAKKNNLPLDVDYYINKQILPPVERILSDFGVKGEMLRFMGEKKAQKETEQRSLFEF